MGHHFFSVFDHLANEEKLNDNPVVGGNSTGNLKQLIARQCTLKRVAKLMIDSSSRPILAYGPTI